MKINKEKVQGLVSEDQGFVTMFLIMATTILLPITLFVFMENNYVTTMKNLQFDEYEGITKQALLQSIDSESLADGILKIETDELDQKLSELSITYLSGNFGDLNQLHIDELLHENDSISLSTSFNSTIKTMFNSFLIDEIVFKTQEQLAWKKPIDDLNLLVAPEINEFDLTVSNVVYPHLIDSVEQTFINMRNFPLLSETNLAFSIQEKNNFNLLAAEISLIDSQGNSTQIETVTNGEKMMLYLDKEELSFGEITLLIQATVGHYESSHYVIRDLEYQIDSFANLKRSINSHYYVSNFGS